MCQAGSTGCAGKDRLVKYWDADKFQLLLELQGHHAEVWAVVVSFLGDFIITAGHDRSFRRWERTEEPFFIEEERERRLESLFEAEAEVYTVQVVTTESSLMSLSSHHRCCGSACLHGQSAEHWHFAASVLCLSKTSRQHDVDWNLSLLAEMAVCVSKHAKSCSQHVSQLERLAVSVQACCGEITAAKHFSL